MIESLSESAGLDLETTMVAGDSYALSFHNGLLRFFRMKYDRRKILEFSIPSGTKFVAGDHTDAGKVH